MGGAWEGHGAWAETRKRHENPYGPDDTSTPNVIRSEEIHALARRGHACISEAIAWYGEAYSAVLPFSVLKKIQALHKYECMWTCKAHLPRAAARDGALGIGHRAARVWVAGRCADALLSLCIAWTGPPLTPLVREISQVKKRA